MSLRHLTAVALAAITVGVATPAWAHPGHEEGAIDLGIELTAAEKPTYRIGQSADSRSPWVAATLSLAGPAMMGLGGYTVAAMPSTEYIRINGMRPTSFAGATMAVASPIGLGFGHAYAGDPWRGLVVGVGGPVVVGGAGLAGYMLDKAMSPGGSWAGLTGIVLGAGLAALGYNIWAAMDAYHTAEIRNERLSLQP